MIEYFARDEAATLAYAARLSQCLEQIRVQYPLQGIVVFLKGQLGAGKTTFCRGLLRALGHEGSVKSPTFTLVEPYELGRGQVYHFDLYRLNDPDELEYMGVEDYMTGHQLCLIEWPERGAGWLPVPDLTVNLKVSGTSRQICLTPDSEPGRIICDCLKSI